MSRAKKPDPKCGPVQPFNPPELGDRLILNLQRYLGIHDSGMHKATVAIESRLGMYLAEIISLDKAPTLASIKAEIEPIMALIYGRDKKNREETQAYRRAT